MEVTVGFEPTSIAFAERSLKPLEYVTMVPQVGLEPTRVISPSDFKSDAYCQFRHWGMWHQLGTRTHVFGFGDRYSTN